MTKQQKSKLIKDWMKDQQLDIEINPTDIKMIEWYAQRLNAKIPELYKLLRDSDVVPENSLQQFIFMLESKLRDAQISAVMRKL